jgi:predicted PurR-regulated permease PerM
MPRSTGTDAADSWTFARGVALAATLGGVALLVWAVLAARNILFITLLAVLFAVLLDGAVRTVRAALWLPRWFVLLFLWVLVAALVVAVAWMLAPRVAEDLDRLILRIPDALEQIDHAVQDTALGKELVEQLAGLWESSTLRDMAARFLGVFSTLVGLITGALVVLVLGMFIASEPDTYVRGAIRLLPRPARRRGAEVAAELGHALRWWLFGRFLSMFVVFVFTWVGLYFMEVPLAFLLALIAGLFSFVPTFGPVASAVPAVLVGLSAGLQQALWVALLYLGIQMVESYGITPFIQRRAVRIPPALLVVFQLMMGVFAGVLGVLLATPILVVLMVLVGMLYVEDRLGQEANLP